MGSIFVRTGALCVVLAAVVGCARAGEPAPGLTEAMLVVEASGTVTDQLGAPIAGAQLDFLQDGMPLASAITGADGTWSAAIEEGVYDVYVAPPPESGLAYQLLHAQPIATDTTLQIVLIAETQVVYSAHIQDRDGAPLPGVQLCLWAECTTSDVDGNAVLSVATGVHMLTLSRDASAGDAPGMPDTITEERRLVAIAGDTSATLTLWTSRFTGTVVGPDGNPVANARMHARSYRSTTLESGWAEDSTTTDANGRFALAVIPGWTSFEISPDAASGVVPLSSSAAIPGDLDLLIELPVGRAYAAHLQDRHGSPLDGIELCMSDDGGAGVCALSSASGDVVLTVRDGWARRSLRWIASDGAHPELPERIEPTHQMEILGDVTETITLENRVVEGVVVDSSGNPVANATVGGMFEPYDPLGWGSAGDVAATDATGRFVLAGLVGTAYLHVTPDPASMRPPFTMTTMIEDDVDLVIALPDSHVYTVHLVDRDGTPVPGIWVCLLPSAGGPDACATTDANGDAPLTVHEGEHTLRIEGWDLGQGATQQLPGVVIMVRHGLMIAADVTETITIENRFLSGTVVDASGNPVAHAVVSLYAAQEIAVDYSVSFDEGMTDANGRFDLTGIVGEAWLRVSPGPESDLPYFEIPVSIADDMSLAVVAQFVGDAVAEPVAAGGTVQTDPEGDGATPADPVETAVTSPVEGTIEIQEAPKTESVPSGYTFLAQQVNVAAPVASATAPLTIVITIDGSRVPAGQDETSIALFRNGVEVPACTGEPGVAAPDPCVSSRARVGDDVVITALSSAASSWNVGVQSVGDGDGDGLFDDVDLCPIDAEDLDGFQDDDGCPDLDDDADGVPDASDACRTEAEDLDGFEDDDGCPEAGPVLESGCPDFDGDGEVTVRDQVAVTRAMGSAVGDRRYQPALDLDRDGDIDVDDLHRLLARRGETCPG